MVNETLSASFGRFLMDFINAVKDENLQWRENSFEKRSELRKRQEISDVDILHSIERIKNDFQQEIAQKSHEFDVRMQKLKLQAQADLNDYNEFLDAIEELKNKMQQFYPDMPRPLLLIVHDYAKQLFHAMWEAEPKRKLTLRSEYVQFLTMVAEDVSPLTLEAGSGSPKTFPQRTLKHIQEHPV